MSSFNLLFAAVLLPLVGIALLARRTRAPLAGWIATFLLALGLTAFSFFTAPWSIFGVVARYGLAALFLIALIVSLIRKPAAEPSHETPLSLIVKVVIALFFGSVAIGALQGRTVPPGAMDLAFPLGRGNYIVEHGGSTPPTNIYASMPAQRFAVDLAKTTATGRRLNAFRDPVLAPCDGTITGLGRSAAALRCGDVVISFAPLARIDVQLGAKIARGTPIGRTNDVLHLFAQRGEEPVPMTFGGRWLVRNDFVRKQ